MELLNIEAKETGADRTPLHEAYWNEDPAAVIELLDANNDSNDSFSPATLGKRKSRGANIEAEDRYGNTHYASLWGHLAVERAFSQPTIMEDFSIQNAVSYGNSEVAKKCLLQHIIYVNICGLTSYWKTSRGSVIPV
jgi:hypothetical protein